MKKVRCKLTKDAPNGIFYHDSLYEVEFAGRVWWAVDETGETICGANECWTVQ